MTTTDSFNLDAKIVAVSAFLRAAGVPEEQALRNIAAFRERLQAVPTIMRPNEGETERQLDTRVRILARAVFNGVSDDDGFVTEAQYAILDLMRGGHDELWDLFGLLDFDEPEAAEFARSFGLTREGDNEGI